MSRFGTLVLAFSLFVPGLAFGQTPSTAAAPAAGVPSQAKVAGAQPKTESGAVVKSATPAAARVTAADATKSISATGAKAKGAGAKLVDLNSATLDELKALAALAPVTDKIVAARPFANKSQLLSKKILDKATYEQVKALIVAHKVKAQ
jgi:DNA uptake protein ComE-like DNA-binding protein